MFKSSACLDRSVSGEVSISEVRSVPGTAVVVQSVPVVEVRSVICFGAVTGAMVGARVVQSADLKPPWIFPRLPFQSFQSYQ